MTPEELEEAILSGAPERVAAVLAGAPESERARASVACERAFDRIRELRQESGTSAEAHERLNRIAQATWTAVLGTASRPDRWVLMQLEPEWIVRVMADRRPAWLERWAHEALADLPQGYRGVRALERAGLIGAPPLESNTVGLISAGASLVEADPGLLEDAVWRLFEVEGTSEISLANGDRWARPEDRWGPNLRRWAAEGRIPRSRLLAASLDALNRDFIQFRAGWFSRFHEELAPTLDERRVLADRYLALLASRIPPTVSFALKALAVLDRAGAPAPEALLAALAPALAAREKATVTLALKLLERAVRRAPELGERGALLAVEALAHEAPEVQAAVLDLVERLQPEPAGEVAAALILRRDDVAPSLKARLESLAGPGVAGATAGGSPAEPDVRARAAALPPDLRARLGIDDLLRLLDGPPGPIPALELPFLRTPRLTGAPITPVGNLDELIELLAVLLERPEPPEAIERALDGLSRLGAERPPDFARRTAPLRKRAAKRYERSPYVDTWAGLPVQDLSALVLVWTGDPVPEDRVVEKPDIDSFLGRRMLELAERLARGETRPLLALPTHVGGWIDPRVLVERVRSAAGWDLCDAVQALLRLAPDHRAEAAGAARDLPAGELEGALLHALGADRGPTGNTAPLWAAAARARDPLASDPLVMSAYPELGPDAGESARMAFRVSRDTYECDGREYECLDVLVDVQPAPRTPADPLFPSLLHHLPCPQGPESRRWCATVWPAGRHAWFGRGVAEVGNNLDWWEARWSNRVYLEALLEPETAMGEFGGLLLGLGLAAKEPGENGLAVDALLAAAADGRLSATHLGEVLARLAATGLVKGARWAKTLSQAAAAGPLARETIREALQCLFVASPAFRPGDLGPLLGLWHEVCVQTGAAVESPAARRFLSGVGSGKAGDTARRLLALAQVPTVRADACRAALLEALDGRFRRAAR